MSEAWSNGRITIHVVYRHVLSVRLISDSAVFRKKIQERSDETIANIAITLIHQCDVLIRGLIEWKKRDFRKNGGIKEEMFRARKDWGKRNGVNGVYGRKPIEPKTPTQPIQPINPIKDKDK